MDYNTKQALRISIISKQVEYAVVSPNTIHTRDTLVGDAVDLLVRDLSNTRYAVHGGTYKMNMV